MKPLLTPYTVLKHISALLKETWILRNLNLQNYTKENQNSTIAHENIVCYYIKIKQYSVKKLFPHCVFNHFIILRFC